MDYKLNVEFIKLKMLQNGYSITKLAKISNTAKSTLSRIINAQGNHRPETIYKLAKALDIDITDLLL